MYAELIEKNKGNRGRIVNVGEIDPKLRRDFEAYSSMFLFDKSIFSHVEYTKSLEDDSGNKIYPNGSVTKFEGAYYAKWLWFDVDNEELSFARKSTTELVNKLTTKYNIKENDIIVYFSGKKGFHVGVSSKHFGGFEASPDLPYKIKRLVERLTDGIESIDTSIYNPNRFFRLPNSKHNASDYYKIALTVSELMENNHLKIREMALSPRLDFKFSLSSQVLPNEELIALWTLSQTEPESSKVVRELLAGIPEGIDERFAKCVEIVSFKNKFTTGNRNNYVFVLTRYANEFGIAKEESAELIYDHLIRECGADDSLFSEYEKTIDGVYKRYGGDFNTKKIYIKENTQFTHTEKTKLFLMDKAISMNKFTRFGQRTILEHIRAVNATQEKPLKDEDVYKIVNLAIDNKSSRSENDYGYTLPDLVPMYLDKLTRKNKGISLGLTEIDEAEEYDYEGKVIGIVGKAGTKKSMLLKEILMVNAFRGLRGGYSSMEDTALRQFQRFINGSFDLAEFEGFQINADRQFKNLANDVNQKEMENLQGFMVNSLDQMFGDKLIIDEKTSQGKEDYQRLLNMWIKRFGEISILGIDGLSMMDSQGNEMQSAIENSKDAKELAKEYNIAIPLLIHVPSAPERDKRQLHDNTRGGSKVADNCDIFLSLSMCIDRDNSVPNNPAYFEDLIYLSYWGKRTTGQHIDMILRLNKLTLRLERTDLDPADFN